jgi:hypothetical protein
VNETSCFPGPLLLALSIAAGCVRTLELGLGVEEPPPTDSASETGTEGTDPDSDSETGSDPDASVDGSTGDSGTE